MESHLFTGEVSRREFVSMLCKVNPDIVHIHGCWSLASARVERWSRQRGYPVILSPHGGLNDLSKRPDFWKHLMPRIILYQYHLTRSAFVLHASSASELSELKALGAQLTGSRMLSKKQVVEHLTRRGGDRNTAEETAQWLEELGAVDEEAYGQAIVRHYSAAGYGSGRIRQELHRRGVPRELWEGLLSRMPPAEETVERFIRGRCRNKTVDEALLRKLPAALQRRGFSWQEIAPALRRLEEETQK